MSLSRDIAVPRIFLESSGPCSANYTNSLLVVSLEFDIFSV